MGPTIEDIPTQTAVHRYIEIARREDPMKWDYAYALRDAVNEEMGSEAGAAAPADNGVKTGLYLAIQRVWEKATDAGVVDAETDILRKHYRTAVAWPEETRVKGATYAAHMELRGLENRQGRLSKWVDRSGKGYFGRDDARRERAELNRKKFGEGIEEKRPPVLFTKAVHRGLSRWATGGRLTGVERREAISILQGIITEIEQRKF